jgi:hypothetical protein
MRAILLVILFLGSGITSTVLAAPPKEKDDAPEVVTGSVQRMDVSEDKYDDGRVVTKHTLILKVETVERTTLDQNRVVRAGDTITVRWSRVDWSSKTTGHRYDVNEKATVRAYLARQCGGEGFYVIDNAGGIEMVTSEDK